MKIVKPEHESTKSLFIKQNIDKLVKQYCVYLAQGGQVDLLK